MSVKAVLRKPTPAASAVIDTSSKPVDENAAERLANELGVGPEETSPTEITPSTAVVKSNPARAVSTYEESSGGGLEGDFDADDIKLPQIKIVNGSGPLSQQYNQGTLLYADEELWGVPDLKPGAKNPVLFFVPVKIVKQFRENLSPDEVEDGMMPRIVSSREEAESLGGSTRWIGQEKPKWSPSAKCILLLREPEGTQHPAFTQILDGHNYAPAVYYCSGTAYNEFAKQIFNAAQLTLRENGRINLSKRFWTWQVVKKQAGKFSIFVPAVRLTKEETGTEVRELAATFSTAAQPVE